MPTPWRHAVQNTIDTNKKTEKCPAELPTVFFAAFCPSLFDTMSLLIKVNRGGCDTFTLHGELTKQKQIFSVSCGETF